MRIRYISYGISKTGGYRHEKFLFEQALNQYTTSNPSTIGEQFRKHKLFSSLVGYFELMFWSFFKSNADINIVPARMGVSAIWRNLFTSKQVWIVIHNHDDSDGKSNLLKSYYNYLFKILRKTKHKRFKVIVVAPFWKNYFENTLQIPDVYFFPNFFDYSLYQTFQSNSKNAWVHLGQYSSKNDKKTAQLAALLSKHGYYCFYSTLNPNEAKQGSGKFDILYFLDFNDYLENVSRSCCTLALTEINEGWNRMAHESILVGTPVIGYKRGGLGDLLKESNSVVVDSIDEAYTCIVNSLWVLPDISFNLKYDVNNATKYITPICQN
jgi:glycosyltransferase involved in cell wall biosynthesis